MWAILLVYSLASRRCTQRMNNLYLKQIQVADAPWRTASKFNGSVTISVLNAAGESVQRYETTLNNSAAMHVATEGWPTGTYFITIESETESIRVSARVVD